jgi:hypothetical protein
VHIKRRLYGIDYKFIAAALALVAFIVLTIRYL